MNQLTKLLGWQYVYDLNIRSLTPQEASTLSNNPSYIKDTIIYITRYNTFGYLWKLKVNALWSYAITIYE